MIEAAYLENSLDNWDLMADCFNGSGHKINFRYKLSEDVDLEILLVRNFCCLPEIDNDDCFIVAIKGVGFEKFNITGETYDTDHPIWNNLSLSQVEKVGMVQLLAALKARL